MTAAVDGEASLALFAEPYELAAEESTAPSLLAASDINGFYSSPVSVRASLEYASGSIAECRASVRKLAALKSRVRSAQQASREDVKMLLQPASGAPDAQDDEANSMRDGAASQMNLHALEARLAVLRSSEPHCDACKKVAALLQSAKVAQKAASKDGNHAAE